MITEAEFNQKIEKGEIEEVKEEKPEKGFEERGEKLIPKMTFKDYQSFLEILRQIKRSGDSVPTHTPKSFLEQFYLYSLGGIERLYMYINGGWRLFYSDDETVGIWKFLTKDTLAAGTTLTLTFTAYDWIKVIFEATNAYAGTNAIYLRLNGISAADYRYVQWQGNALSTEATKTSFLIYRPIADNDRAVGELMIQGKHSSGTKAIVAEIAAGDLDHFILMRGRLPNDSANLTSMTFFATENFDVKIKVYGLNY